MLVCVYRNDSCDYIKNMHICLKTIQERQIQYIKLLCTYISHVLLQLQNSTCWSKTRHDNIFVFYSLTFYKDRLTGIFLSAVKDQLCQSALYIWQAFCKDKLRGTLARVCKHLKPGVKKIFLHETLAVDSQFL